MMCCLVVAEVKHAQEAHAVFMTMMFVLQGQQLRTP